MAILLFEPSFGGLRGNIRTSSIARCKARSLLPIRDNWTFFASFYGWDLSRYWSKSAFFGGDGSLWAQIFGGRGRCPTIIVCIRILECLCYLTVKRHDPIFIRLCVTDRQTDRWTDTVAVANTASALHCKQCGRAVKITETLLRWIRT